MNKKTRLLAVATMLAGAFLMTDCKKDKDALPFFFLMGDDASSAPGTTTTGETSSGTTVTTTNTDVVGTGDFEFQTTETIDINVNVTDDDGPVQGANVSVKDTQTEDTLFQGVTDENGNASGTIEVTPDTETVSVTIEAGGETIEQEVNTDNLQEINREVVVEGTVDEEVIADADGDGIADEDDAYPDDATRATRVIVPSADGQVVAYEDLYPSPGDADFNDYVVKVNNELDLDASGKVVRVRGTYQHIARGAGYKHTLHLTLPGTGAVTKKLYKADGTLQSEDSSTGSLTAIE
ncbi:MAG: LruC domain-containing protein, partial [Leptospiraceae bacterium]|nr:LruC domain-containing protein [Leptospiraceae bacterium]